jgi:hypothetical protein
MTLTDDDINFLVNNDAITSDMVFSKQLRDEIKTFLCCKIGYQDILGEISEELVAVNFIRNNLNYDRTLNQFENLKPILKDAYLSGSLADYSYRKSLNDSSYIYATNNAVYVVEPDFTRKVAECDGIINSIAHVATPDSIGNQEYEIENIIYIGGSFSTVNGVSCSNIAKLTFSPLVSESDDPDSVFSDNELAITTTQVGDGLNGAVNKLFFNSGTLLIGGNFTQTGSTSISKIAFYGGTDINSYGTGTISDEVTAIYAKRSHPYETFIGTNGSGSNPRVYFNNPDGSWEPVLFNEITNDHNNTIDNGVVYDIAYDGTYIAIVGDFIVSTNLSADPNVNILIGNFENNTVTFSNVSCNRPIRKVKIGNDSVYIIIEDAYLRSSGFYGNLTLNDVSFETRTGLLVMKNLSIGISVDDIYNPVETNGTGVRDLLYSNGVICCGDFTVVGTDVQEMKNNRETIVNSKGYNNVFVINNDNEIESPNNVESYYAINNIIYPFIYNPA